jgi:hypothetical protein
MDRFRRALLFSHDRDGSGEPAADRAVPKTGTRVGVVEPGRLDSCRMYIDEMIEDPPERPHRRSPPAAGRYKA